MGLDNGIYIKSNKREITRDMLPEGIVFPFEKDYDDAVEILYWRKNWGLRNAVINTFGWFEGSDGYYEIDTPEQVREFIKIVASFLDEEKWEEDGNSIWSYDEIRDVLVQNIINLAIVYTLMEANPDIYLVFYDSY